MAAPRPQCTGLTRKGTRCIKAARAGETTCAQHDGTRSGTVAQLNARASQAAFLAAYRVTGNITVGCDAAGVARSTFYAWRDIDPEFVAELVDARDEAADLLEIEARRRAVEGVVRREKKAQQPDGTWVTSEIETVYSDQLLMFLLKAARPETYRERSSVEVSGSVEHGTAITRAHRDSLADRLAAFQAGADAGAEVERARARAEAVDVPEVGKSRDA